MRTFADKPAARQRIASSRLSIPAFAGLRREFNQNPVLSPATGAQQAPLLLSQPGDEHEQSAERLSERALRGPAQEPGPGIRRRQTTGGEPAVLGQASIPPLVGEVIRSPGQALDPATREFMESRFGYDFSQVRVYLDVQAAGSAQAVSALAYTSGDHIVFAGGQYNPSSEVGRRLLAHELAHTVQPGGPLFSRKFDFTQPKPKLRDPIPLAMSGNILGKTYPGLNGKLLPKTAIKKAYKEEVFKTLQPQTYAFSDSKGSKTCKVDPKSYNITVYAEVEAITKPQGGKWSGSYTPDKIKNLPSVCTENSDKAIPVELRGKPDSDALCEKVQTHEQEHVKDLESLSTKKLKKYHDFLLGLSGAGATEKECVDDLYKKVGDKDAVAANEFVDEWLDAVQVYDKPGGTHHSKFVTKVDAKCEKVQVTEKL